MKTLASYVPEFLRCVDERNIGDAIDLLTRLADQGAPIVDLFSEVVSPAQREIGERWHRNEISVADEHAATAVAEAVVATLSATPRTDTTGVQVAVGCAEGEWHTLPAKLLTETLQDHGHQVTFLGPSTPAAHLGRFLERTTPDVLAVSCTTPLAFTGVLSFVHVAHDAAIPVIVGGRAMGRTAHRAEVLGADLWAPTASAAAVLLEQPLPTSLREPTADTGAAMELAFQRDQTVTAAMAELGRRFPPMSSFTVEQLARTEEDFAFILQFAEAAILTDDGSLFDEFLEWLDLLLSVRGLPPGALDTSVRVLADVTTAEPIRRQLQAARQGR